MKSVNATSRNLSVYLFAEAPQYFPWSVNFKHIWSISKAMLMLQIAILKSAVYDIVVSRRFCADMPNRADTSKLHL